MKTRKTRDKHSVKCVAERLLRLIDESDDFEFSEVGLDEDEVATCLHSACDNLIHDAAVLLYNKVRREDWSRLDDSRVWPVLETVAQRLLARSLKGAAALVAHDLATL